MNQVPPIRILILDGSDIRALSQMESLKEIMSRIQCDKKSKDEILPCRYFHLIVGVGTGGVFAAFLGILEMPIEEAQEEFIKLYKSVFDKDTDDRTTRSLKLEEFLKDLLVRKGHEADMLLQQAGYEDTVCDVLLGASLAQNLNEFQGLRNYKGLDGPNKFTLVEALRATWADSDLFTPVYVGPEGRKVEYVGCSINFKNPAREAAREAARRYTDARRVSCILSLGGGNSHVSKAGTILEQAARAIPDRTTADLEQQWGKTGIYYRFSDTLNFEESKDPGLIVGSATSYISQESTILDQCVTTAISETSRVTIGDLCRASTNIPKVTPTLSNLSPYFMNRPTIIQKMNDIFSKWKEGSGKIMVISGMGGIGKTQIARKFAGDHANEFSFIFTIDASSEATIEADLISAVSGVIGKKSVNNVKEAIKHLSGAHELFLPKSLIVFDNADDPDISLNKFIPEGRDGYIIITTRNQTLQSLAPHAYLELEVMSRQEATELLLKIAAGSMPAPGDTSRATEIVEELGCLPLAIVQAGSYIKTKHCMRTYLNQFRASRARLLSHEMGQQLDKSHRAVYAALNVTHDSLSLKVKQMLRILSFLRPMRISVRFILWAAEHGFDLQLPNYLPRQETYEGAIRLLRRLFSASNPWTEFDTRILIEELQKYSLVTITNDEKTPETLQFHRLVFAWIHDQLMQEERPAILTTTICLLLCGAHNSGESVVDDIVPHVQALSVSPAWTKLHTNDRAALLGVLHLHGDARDLLRHWKRIRSEVAKVYGADDLKTSEVDLRWADAHWRNGEYDMASRLEGCVVSLRAKKLGPDDPSTLSAIARQALGHYNRGDFASAATLQFQVLELRKKSASASPVDVAQAMEDLADTYNAQSLFDEARRLVEASLEIRILVHGLRHSTVSGLQEKREHLMEQEMIYNRSFPEEKVRSTSDKSVHWTKNNGLRYQYLEPAQPINWRPWLGELWYPRTPLWKIPPLESRSRLLELQGSYGEAKRLREIALAVRMKNQRITSPAVMEAIEALAHLDECILKERINSKSGYGSGKVAPVLRIWKVELVFQERKETLGIGDLQTLLAGEELANAYRSEGRRLEADVLGLQIGDVVFRVLDHQKLAPSAQTLQRIESLAHIKFGLSIEQDTTTRRIALVEKLVNVLKRMHGAIHSDVIKATEDLICLYESQNDESAINNLIAKLSTDIFEFSTSSSQAHAEDVSFGEHYTSQRAHWSPFSQINSYSLAQKYLNEINAATVGNRPISGTEGLTHQRLKMESVFQMFSSPIFANIFKLQAAKDILRFVTAVHGDDHAMTMEAMELLAEGYEARGMIDDAASLRLEVAEKRFEQQQDLDTSLEEVALDEALDRESEADSLRLSTAEKRLQTIKESSGPVDRATLVAAEALAREYESQNRKSDANVLRWQVADDKVRFGNGQFCPFHPVILEGIKDRAKIFDSPETQTVIYTSFSL